MWAEIDTRTGRTIKPQGADLVGKSYPSRAGGTIRVIDVCPINPTTDVVLEWSGRPGEWACHHAKVRSLIQ